MVVLRSRYNRVVNRLQEDNLLANTMLNAMHSELQAVRQVMEEHRDCAERAKIDRDALSDAWTKARRERDRLAAHEFVAHIDKSGVWTIKPGDERPYLRYRVLEQGE